MNVILVARKAFAAYLISSAVSIVGEQHRRFEQIERAVERAQDRAGGLAIGADDDAVGAHEILDRRAFAQEFGVRGDVEAASGGCIRGRISATWRPVPTGTVDLVTTTA